MKYSVLMGVYYKDKPLWLKESIDSILNQTIKPSEFVLVVDGPLTNELDKIIDDYIKNNHQLFKVIRSEENKGIGAILGKGVNTCSNEIIARMDADDISVPDRIEKELKIFKEKDLDIIGSWIAEFEDDPHNIVGIRKLPQTHEEIIKYAKKRNPFAQQAVIFKKSKVIAAGNYRNLSLLEDYDLWIRMLLNNCKSYNIEESLVYVRVNKDTYKRRGGIKYLKNILAFKKYLYKLKYINILELIYISLVHFIVCLIPNKIRRIFYLKFLRS